MIHHDWILRVYDWLGTERKVLKSRSNEEVENMPGGQKWEYITNELMDRDYESIFTGWYIHSPVGFCYTEIPVVMLLEESHGYKMGPPDQREIKCIHSLFIDGLKTYQLNHQNLKMAYEILVQASMVYSVKKMCWNCI